jgi:hypothetical protein
MLFVPYAPNDEIVGDWSREELLKMDASFTSAVATAIRNGLESPAAVSATVRIARSKAVVEAAALEAAWNMLWEHDGEMAFAEVVKVVQSCCPGVTADRVRIEFEKRLKEMIDHAA